MASLRRWTRTSRSVPEGPPTPQPPVTPSLIGHGPRSVHEPPPVVRHPMVHAGILAWSLVGLALAAMGGLYVVGQLRLVVVPLVLALFPAALLAPAYKMLRSAKLPPAIAALIVLLGSLGLFVGVAFVLVPQVADEVPTLTTQVQSGLSELQAFLESGPFGLDPVVITDGIAQVQENIAESDILRTGVLGAAGAVAEITTMLLLLLVVLFFYLKDGTRIADWLRSIFPAHLQHDVGEISTRAWTTIGAYFRGQIFVALVDGTFIGIGLALLGVPLALPLGVLVFFASLFPIVGAIASGALAVLVALATGGPGVALAALLIVVGVQQLESNVLAPLVLGKATALHPLAVLTSLTAGGILLGVLGAFLAVPIAASLARGVGYLRERDDSPPPTTDTPGVPRQPEPPSDGAAPSPAVS